MTNVSLEAVLLYQQMVEHLFLHMYSFSRGGSGFLEREFIYMYKSVRVCFADFISFFLTIL